MQNDGSVSAARQFFRNRWVLLSKLAFVLVVFSLCIIYVSSCSALFPQYGALTTGQLQEPYAGEFPQNNITGWNPNECGDGSNSNGECVDPSGDKVTWIGDSYTVGAECVSKLISEKLPGVDIGNFEYSSSCEQTAQSYAKVSKFVSSSSSDNPAGIEILRTIKNAGKLRPYLVFALGTNGGITESQIDEIMNIAGDNTKVVFVTIYMATQRSYVDSSNVALAAAKNRYSNAIVADWAAVASNDDYADDPSGIHPTKAYDKWVKTIVDALPKNCSGGGADLLPGSTIAEKVWNWFVKAGIPGVSDNAAVISGIMGNLLTESGINPFMVGGNGDGFGLHMNLSAYGGAELHQEVNNAVGKDYFKFYGWWSDETDADRVLNDASVPQDAIDKAIDIELKRITGGGYWDSEFLPGIKDWGVANTPQGYSDLFLVTMERATGNPNPAPITDSGVANHYSGMYQDADSRRNNAQYIYDKYATAVNPGNSTGGSSVNSSGTMNLTTTGDITNYAGDIVWGEEGGYLEALKRQQPVYEASAKKHGIPWQLLATLHRLERGMGLDNPSNGQGIYQLYSYTDGGSNSNAFLPAGPIDDAEFQRQTDIAAEIVKGMMEDGGYDPSSDDGVKYVIFSFNGRASQYKAKALAMGFTQEQAEAGEGSPYVMNRYDARRDPNSSEMDPNWPGRFTGDGVYTPGSTMSDFGGFVLYAAIAGLGWSGAENSGYCLDDNQGSNGGELIAKTARELAWPDNDHHYEVKPEFAAAAAEVGSPTSLGFAQDCGHFVSVVVRKSGVDPDYDEGGTPNMESRMHKSDLWEEIPNNGSEDNLQPGDIFVANAGSGGFGSDIYPSAGFGAGGHIWIYLGNNEMASASLNSRTGNLDTGVYYSESYAKYRIFRSTVKSDMTGGTVGSFDEGLRAIESEQGVQVGAAVTAPGNKDSSSVQVGGSWTGGRAWSTIKVPLSIAAIQKNASAGTVTDPYGGSCSHSIGSAVNLAITQSDNCAAWWLWTALGGDGSSAAGDVTSVISSGGDSSTSVTSNGDGGSLTSGKTTWSLLGQAIFMANISSIGGSESVMNEMRTHNAGDGAHGLNTFTSMAKGGWGNDGGTSATRQLGIIKLSNGKCSAVAIGTNAGSNFSILDQIAQVLLNHQDELPSGNCPGGL